MKTRIWTLICGVVSIVLGLGVMLGWHMGSQTIVQVHPTFAPMQYNTALCFFLCGLGILAAIFNKHWVARALGLCVLGLGGVTLAQYMFDLNFCIDELLMEARFTTKTSHPGRMAPNTALCFLIAGMSLTVVGFRRALMVSLTLCVLVLATLSLVGYIGQQEGMYGWGALTRMAIHTMSGFLIVSVGLLLHAIWGWGEKRFDFWHILPFAVAVMMVCITFFAWYTYKESVEARNKAYLEDLITDTQDILLERYTLYEKALRGGLGLYYASNSVERHEWRKYVQALDVDEHLPGISGVGYIDYVLAQDLDDYLNRTRLDNAPSFNNHPQTFYPDKFIIKFIEPVQRNDKAVGLDIGFEANRRAAAERARDLGVPALTKKITLVQDDKKQPGFLLLIPVYEENKIPPTIEKRRESFQGWVYAPFIGADFLGDLGRYNKNQLDFQVYDGKKASDESLIYASDDYGAYQNQLKQMRVETQLKIAGRTWTVFWYPNQSFTPPASEKLIYFILVFGVGFAGFLYVTLAQLLRSKTIIEKKVEERTKELTESEAKTNEAMRFREMVTNSIPDFIFVKDAEFKIVDANEAFLNLYPEDARDGVIGSDTAEHYNDEEAEEFLKHDKKALEEGYSEVEENITFPNGEERLLLTKKVRFENASGEAFILGIARDITEMKEAHLELERSNHELERFAYIASHDLQEPLRKIGGFTERLEKRFADQIQQDEKAQKYMYFILDGVERMRDLVQGLLEYSRVTTSDLEGIRLDASVIVEDAIENLSKTVKDNTAEIHCENLPSVVYDRVMLTQVFQNLIGNAIKYRGKDAPRIKISAEKSGDVWVFSIKDNGMGMEEKYLNRIFEMFQRLHRKEEIAGTGIGLSLCQKIVERYGGKIWVTSELGEGSTFYFTVPDKIA